jgi:hypothetical protein
MKPTPQQLLACSLAALACALPLQAQALRIDGLRPFDGPVAGTATPAVVDGSLEIALASERKLGITPWPAFLPQQFAPQTIAAERRAGPAGPSDKLSMRRAKGGAPWLEVAGGARQSSPVVGGWRLKLNTRGWWLAQGTKLYFLGKDADSMRVARVPDGRERWCVYLLGVSLPQARTGVATESEAQADWAALRLDTPGQRCPQND